ncbi:MAG: phosphatidate cytidylyltransferase [Proteobacteria bacterium]|nr:phosphatidate cytidylyltransferase [Pseudomonadota bacterium]HQR02958.1 phosphatidate cytidylyltransferase [Rhodocyclaceae bacterium]
MLKTRIVTALILVAGLSLLLFAAPLWALQTAFALAAAVAAWEWAGFMAIDRGGRVLYGAFVLILCWMAHVKATVVFVPLWLSVAGFWLLVAPLWLARRWRLGGNDMVAYLLGALLIVSTWSALAAMSERGPWTLLGVLAVVWVADIGAYFAGRRYGRRKLAPSISPGKTWEGAAGGVLGVLCYGLIVVPHLLPIADAGAFLMVTVALVIVAILSIQGDLFESLLKRQAGLKDSSQVLPGHGGVLDRIDSVTSTLPVVALAFQYLLP